MFGEAGGKLSIKPPYNYKISVMLEQRSFRSGHRVFTVAAKKNAVF
jgi:hypothetical protein